ncbi:MAG: hypothetical protein ACLUNO_01810 [Oscillospiraceae bacterium]
MSKPIRTSGPNNEVYLAKGQAITFTVPRDSNIASVQIGAKAPSGSAAQMVVTGGNRLDQVLSTATEMYYEIGASGGSFTITNTGDGILSLTNLKITFTVKPNSAAALSAPTAEGRTPRSCLCARSLPSPSRPLSLSTSRPSGAATSARAARRR